MRSVEDMRLEVATLEKHKFVMSDRALRLEAEVAPRRVEVETLSKERVGRDADLARALLRIHSLTQTVRDREATLKCAPPPV